MGIIRLSDHLQYGKKIASTLDAKLASGDDLPLGFGIPVGIKDNMCLENEHNMRI